MALQDQLDTIEDKIRTRQKEINELQEEASQLKKNRADELLAELKALGIDRAPRKTGERKPKTCSICKKQGNAGTGHTKATHAQWMKDQK